VGLYVFEWAPCVLTLFLIGIGHFPFFVYGMQGRIMRFLLSVLFRFESRVLQSNFLKRTKLHYQLRYPIPYQQLSPGSEVGLVWNITPPHDVLSIIWCMTRRRVLGQLGHTDSVLVVLTFSKVNLHIYYSALVSIMLKCTYSYLLYSGQCINSWTYEH